MLEYIRGYFFSCKRNEVYDFLEFTAKNADWAAEGFREMCNLMLEREI